MSKIFINATNHNLTATQLQDISNKGFEVVELPESIKSAWGNCSAETWNDTYERFIEWYHSIEADEKVAMIAGYAPLTFNVVYDLDRNGDIPLYADSKRESVEKVLEDGSVVKQNVFKHLGFFSQVTGEPWM